MPTAEIWNDMRSPSPPSWFSIRFLYDHGDGAFGERIFLVKASGPREALSVAERSSETYLGLNPGFDQIGCAMIGDLGVADPEIGEAIVWDMLYESKLDSARYLERYYSEREIDPE